MDIDDFEAWLGRHQQLVPTVAHWFGQLPDQVEVAKAWFYALQDIDLSEARAVTDLIVRGDIERPWPEDTPRICRLRALEARQTRRRQESDSGAVHRFCGLCRGSGTITVWHPLVVRAVRHKSNGVYRHPVTGQQFVVRHADGSIKSITAAAACKCTIGERFRERLPPPAFLVPVQFRERGEYAGLSLEDVIELDISASPFLVEEWEFA